MKSLELTYLDHQFCFLYSNLILLNTTSLIPDIFVMSSTCKSIVNSKSFQRLIIFTILLAGIVVGIQTFKIFAQNEEGITYVIKPNKDKLQVLSKNLLSTGPDDIFRSTLSPIDKRIYSRSHTTLFWNQSVN